MEGALAKRRKALGPNHPDVANSLNNLGSHLEELGDVAGARKCYEEALAIRKLKLGMDAK